MFPPADRYPDFSPSISARESNAVNALTYRKRKADAALLGAPMSTVNVDPGWDAFNGALEHLGQQANDAGMTSRVNLHGIGNASTAPDRGAAMPTGTYTGPTDNIDYYNRQAALRALQAKADTAEAGANAAVFGRDPAFQRQDTANAIARGSAFGDFEREQAVKDAANTAAVYTAGEPTRRAQQFAADRQREEDYPFSKEAAAVEEARLKSDAARRESESQRSREVSQGIRTLGELSRQQANTPATTTTPGAHWWSSSTTAPNPAFDALQRQIEDTRNFIGMERAAPGQRGPGPNDQPGTKTISQDEMREFIQSTPGMTPEKAFALAKQHGWTIQ